VVLDAPPSAGLVMDQERVYVPVQGSGVRALSRSSGEVVWSEAAGTRWAPLAADGRLFIVLPDGIRAMQAATGGGVWEYALDQPASGPPRVHGTLLVVPTESGEIVALDAATGQVAWRRSLGSPSTHPLAFLGTVGIVTTGDGRVIALDARTGEVRWERSLPGMLSPPATARDRVFVGSTNNFFYALDADDGDDVWRWRTGGDVVGAAATEDRVYFVSLDNILRAVNRDNGNQQWKAEIPTRPAAPPVAVGDVVVVVGVAPRIDAFIGRTGAALGSYVASTDLQGVPAIDPDLKPFQVAIASLTHDGNVVGLRPTRMMLPDPPLGPLLQLPGRELPPERLPRTSPPETPPVRVFYGCGHC
jgi:outer membrane protein assembly factor BamB